MVHKITGWIFGFLNVYMEYGESRRFINLCRNNGIEIWNIRADREKGIIWFCIRLSDFWKLHHIAKKCHVFPRVYRRIGFPFLLTAAKKNINMVMGIAIFFIMLIVFSSRIWGIEISGQSYYTEENIVDYLDTKNIYCGMYGGNIDHENIEKQIRKHYDGIGWVSVNKKGSRLLVNVREMTKDKIITKKKPADLVASDDGKVISIVTSAGTAKVRKGKKVKKGKVLISGIVPVVGDNDEVIRKLKVRADGIVLLKNEELYTDYYKRVQKIKEYTGRKKVVYKITAFKKDFFIHNPLNDLETSKKCAILYDGGCVCPFLTKRFPVLFRRVTFAKYAYVRKKYSPEEAAAELKYKYKDYIRKKEKTGYKLVDSSFMVDSEGTGYKATGKLVWLKRQTHYEKIRQKRNMKNGNNGNSSGNTG